MNQELDDKEHLSPRQIINRYKKGEYVDESIEAISSTISSCPYTFDSVAVPFQSTIVDKVLENISIAKMLYELQKDGKSTDGVEIPDYPELRDFLMDLSYPPLWEAMQEGRPIRDHMAIMCQQNLKGKYHLVARAISSHRVVDVSAIMYRKNIEEAGLSYDTLLIALGAMFELE